MATGAAALILASTGLGYLGWHHLHHPDVNYGWSLAAVDGDQLSIQFTHGACDIVHGVRVSEDEHHVVVALRVRPWRSGFCTANLLVECKNIQLRQPLGNRVLLNPVADPPVVVNAVGAPSAGAHGVCA